MRSIHHEEAWKEQRLVCWTRYALSFEDFRLALTSYRIFKICGAWKMQRIEDFQKIGRMIEKKLKHHFRFFPAMICICSRARSSCFLCDLHGSLSNVVSQVFIEFFSEVSFKIWSYFFSKFPNFLWNFWEFSYFFSKFRL